ncbi:hypothetical protein HRI_002809000 [Hibiscus trionum]|uniref:Myb/SANT-like domain-containing protein n=1 Tax=Hibiscus trionum TaxID=183268 RepID=A0A9W7M650_HIBTR|nr:hypothetical protein HRI_002809000 [Hibiscus trionum]
MDDVLINALLHQQSLGNRVDKFFTSMAYENMVNELHEKIGMPVEKGQLKKNRIKTLKHSFFECYDSSAEVVLLGVQTLKCGLLSLKSGK